MVVGRLPRREAHSFNRSAFGEFSLVQAAVLLVAAAVLNLMWARSQRKAFDLPSHSAGSRVAAPTERTTSSERQRSGRRPPTREGAAAPLTA